MPNLTVLAPAAVLIAWTLAVTLWLLLSRLRAFSRVGLILREVPKGGRYADVEANMPERANWVSHNYTHLLEQPTLFYALCAILAIADAGEAAALWAWAYALLRIAHSLWQLLVNVVIIRLGLFLASNICLFVLAWKALRLTAL
jgi:hypothetical protein